MLISYYILPKLYSYVILILWETDPLNEYKSSNHL